MFELFEPGEEVYVTAHHLPHWEQAGATYFITWRTADSLPKDVIAAWVRERDAWLRKHQVNALNESLWERVHELPALARREYHERFTNAWFDRLDDCQGECLLKRPELAKVVADSLLHFDGERYHLSDFVVMPNHVHLLVQFLGATSPAKQCYSWKRFTAVEINRQLGRIGSFWQDESFDHLVRTPAQFEAIRRYIANNPVKAKLRDGEYSLWRRER
jgi:putative transposase